MSWRWSLSGVSRPGDPTRPNEDFWTVTDTMCVVLDGAGAPPGLDTGCRHGTDWYVRELGYAIVDAAASEPTLPLRGTLSAAIASVAGKHCNDCDLAHPGTPSSTVAIVRHVEGELEYLILGDSPLVLMCDSGVRCIQDRRVETVERAAVAHVPPAAAINSVAARTAVIKFLRGHRNRPGGYWVADSNPHAAQHAIVGSVQTSAVAGFAVMTDGASRLVHLFGALSWTELMAALDRDGPQATLELLRYLESRDSACRRWPRTKACDDATIVVQSARYSRGEEAACTAQP